MRMLRFLCLCAAAALPARALETDHGPGESSFKFLKLPLSPRIVALGGAGAGLADDAASLDLNPAAAAADSGHLVAGRGYPFAEFQGASSHITWAVPLDGNYRLLVNARYLGFDKIEGWDETDGATSSYGAHTLKLQAGLAGAWNKGAGTWGELQWGATLNYAGNSVASANYATAMVNAGARYMLPYGLVFGASVLNADFWGSKAEDAEYADPFPPTAVQVGLAYARAFGAAWKAAVAADARARNDEDAAFPAGAEVTWRDMITVRAGFPFGEPEPGFSAGVGLHWSIFRFAYAFQSHAALGPGHFWSLDLAY
jgi:hypothetical protein